MQGTAEVQREKKKLVEEKVDVGNTDAINKYKKLCYKYLEMIKETDYNY